MGRTGRLDQAGREAGGAAFSRPEEGDRAQLKRREKFEESYRRSALRLSRWSEVEWLHGMIGVMRMPSVVAFPVSPYGTTSEYANSDRLSPHAEKAKLLSSPMQLCCLV